MSDVLLRASLVVGRLNNDLPFMPGAGPNGGDFFLPWRKLKSEFALRGIDLHTADCNAGHSVAFELHLNVQRSMSKPPSCPCYVYLYEDPVVRPINSDKVLLSKYRLAFGSNQNLISSKEIIPLDCPNDLNPRDVPDWLGRDLHCVMIASNKALLYTNTKNLHATRVDVIREFEKNDPERFALYGPGWNIPEVKPGYFGRICKRLNEWLCVVRPNYRPFLTYRGTVSRKSEVLDRAKFCICYENSRGSPGYITEKIFDCFVSGCVPIYIGARHVQNPIPASCYIDGDAFESPRALRAYLDQIGPSEFSAYQAAMREFITSHGARRFTNEVFCSTLVNEILSDLCRGTDCVETKNL